MWLARTRDPQSEAADRRAPAAMLHPQAGRWAPAFLRPYLRLMLDRPDRGVVSGPASSIGSRRRQNQSFPNVGYVVPLRHRPISDAARLHHNTLDRFRRVGKNAGDPHRGAECSRSLILSAERDRACSALLQSLCHSFGVVAPRWSRPTVHEDHLAAAGLARLTFNWGVLFGICCVHRISPRLAASY